MWSSRIEGPGLDMLETERHASKTWEKEKVFLDTFVSFLVIGVLGVIHGKKTEFMLQDPLSHLWASVVIG